MSISTVAEVVANHERGMMSVRNAVDAVKHQVQASSLDYSNLVKDLRKSIRQDHLTTYEFRMEQFNKLRSCIAERCDDIISATRKDLGRHPNEAFQLEVMTTLGELDIVIRDLKSWMQPAPCEHPLLMKPGKAMIVAQPKGVVLVICPWNFPIYLALGGIISALAAGNAVVVKPSEMTPNSAKILEEIVNKAFDPRVVRVVQGGVPETTALLRERWDHILYTGNGAVGRIIHTAAAKHLTPVTLELGGKSPVYVDKSANLSVAASRIISCKNLNAGQVCVAPDYVLVHESMAKDLVQELKDRVKKFYGEKPQSCASFARLVNAHHFDRIKHLLQNHGGEVIIGGLDLADRNDKFIPPTIVFNPNPNSPLMNEEIFGPVLPVMVVRDENEAIEFINSKESPLALYVFSEDEQLTNKVVEQTLAGGTCVNDCIFHVANPAAPFGGVGTSGMGAYHGKAGFDEFSHRRTVMFRHTWLDPANRYPPYKPEELPLLKKIIIGPIIPPAARNAIVYGGAAVAGYTFIRSLL